MLDTLWIGARLATMTKGAPYGAVGLGAIAIDGGHVAWVGRMEELPAAPAGLARTVHSAEGRWVTPGLIDCHTHLVYGGDRCEDFEMRLRGASPTEIARAGGGVLMTVEKTRAASVEDLSVRAERRLAALAREGVTTIEIKSGYGLDLDTEMKILRVARKLADRLPVSVHTTFGVYAVPREYEGRAEAYVDHLCRDVLPAVARKRLVDAVDVQLDEMGFSGEQTARLFEAARGLGLALRTHTDELSDFGGAAFAAAYGARTADHLEYVSEQGVAAMAEAGMIAVLLPGTTYTLRRQKTPPVELFRQYAVPMALASNCNPGPSPATSLLMMLNMGCTLYRLTPEEALAGVTRNAAAALGLAATHGTIEAGKVADLVLWDIERPAELAYTIGFNPCAAVIKGGAIVRGQDQFER
jgi:imidazolonepropionase